MWWWEARKITVAEIIASTHPHVIGLQEVRVGECREERHAVARVGEQALRAQYSTVQRSFISTTLNYHRRTATCLNAVVWGACRAVYCPFFIASSAGFFLVLSFPSLVGM